MNSNSNSSNDFSSIGTLSKFLIPLLVLFYIFFENMRPVLFYTIICVAIIGSINTLYKHIDGNNSINTVLFQLLVHLPLLLILFQIETYGYFNTWSILMLLFAILVIVYLPYWPYEIRRDIFGIIYVLIYFLFFGIYFYKY